MRKLLLIAVVLAAAFLMSFTILDNTLVSQEIDAQTLTAEATKASSAISLKGYENAHILAPYTFSATEASTIELTLYKATGTSASFTEFSSTTAEVSVTKAGVLELEAVRDMTYPYIKVQLTNNASPATVISGVTVVFYGSQQKPF